MRASRNFTFPSALPLTYLVGTPATSGHPSRSSLTHATHACRSQTAECSYPPSSGLTPEASQTSCQPSPSDTSRHAPMLSMHMKTRDRESGHSMPPVCSRSALSPTRSADSPAHPPRPPSAPPASPAYSTVAVAAAWEARSGISDCVPIMQQCCTCMRACRRRRRCHRCLGCTVGPAKPETCIPQAAPAFGDGGRCGRVGGCNAWRAGMLQWGQKISNAKQNREIWEGCGAGIGVLASACRRFLGHHAGTRAGSQVMMFADHT